MNTFLLLSALAIPMMNTIFIALLGILAFSIFCVVINIFFFTPQVTIDPIDLLLSEDELA